MEEFLKKYGLKRFADLDEKVKSDSIFAVNLVNDLVKEKFAIKDPAPAVVVQHPDPEVKPAPEAPKAEEKK